jgi:predicted nucleotidyltransferase
MPVRSLNSPVMKWPNRKQVDEAVRKWADSAINELPGIIRLGYFGSYARGDWGVGSDLDLVAVVKESSDPFEMRSTKWDLSSLPVQAEILVYTEDEWRSLMERDDRFARTLAKETVWVVGEAA